MLDPVEHMNIKEKPFKEIVKKIAAFDKRLKTHPLHENARLEDLLGAYGRKADLMKESDEAKAELKGAKSLLQMKDLKCMKRVLRRLGYCTAADVIEVLKLFILTLADEIMSFFDRSRVASRVS